MHKTRSATRRLSVKEGVALLAKGISRHEARVLLAKKPKRSKYGAIKKVVDGITFASTGEANRYAELKLMVEAREIYALRLQVKYPLSVRGIHITNYIADFVYKGYDIRTDTVTETTEDFKGIRTPEYRLKKKLMKALHGIDIYETSSRRLTPRRTKTKSPKPTKRKA